MFYLMDSAKRSLVWCGSTPSRYTVYVNKTMQLPLNCQYAQSDTTELIACFRLWMFAYFTIDDKQFLIHRVVDHTVLQLVEHVV